MPFFSAGIPSLSSPSETLPPNRASRTACWAARDTFFACLDANGIVDGNAEAEEASKKSCGKEAALLQKDCAASWITHFRKRRIMEVKKAAMLKALDAEGARRLDGELPSAAAAAAVQQRKMSTSK